MPGSIRPRSYVTMRTIAFEFGASGDGPWDDPFITEVARIDLFRHPVLGLKAGDLQAMRYEPSVDDAGPFAGLRLAEAIWTPQPPDVLVSARPETSEAIPPELRAGLPWIFVLRAWRRVMPRAPSRLLQDCWDRGPEIAFRDDGGTLPEREAWFASMLLGLLVERAPLEELVAMSGA